MITLEQSRAAARPRDRYAPSAALVSLLCMRCERPFRTVTLARECFLCDKAARRVYGTSHPVMEMSG